MLVIYCKFRQSPSRGFGATGGRIWLFPLLWLGLFVFTTACNTVQAAMHVAWLRKINNDTFIRNKVQLTNKKVKYTTKRIQT